MDAGAEEGAQEIQDGMQQSTSIQQLQLQQQQQHLQAEAMRTAAFWQSRMQEIQMIDPQSADVEWTMPELPLARIKKIMKSEDEVKAELGSQRFMISAEAPVMFAKACEIFVLELTLLAWNYTEDAKRRTLQRNDIVNAVGKNDTYDFLIDIVPREGAKSGGKGGDGDDGMNMPVMDEAQYQLWQQAQAQAQEQQQRLMQDQLAKLDPQQQEELQKLEPEQQMQYIQQLAAQSDPAMQQQMQMQMQQMMWQQQMQMQMMWQQQQGEGEGVAESGDENAMQSMMQQLVAQQQQQADNVAATTDATNGE